MNNYPKYVEVHGIKYPINTDFRIALEINNIWQDDEVSDYEKALATIYKLFGRDALLDKEYHKELFDLALKYLKCNEEENKDNEELSMDFEQDQGYIKASFMSDYNIDLDSKEMHFWAFYDLLKGLTDKCILNRVRYIREEPLNDKKGKDREQWIKAKKQVALRVKKTKEQEKLDKLWEEKMRKR